MKFLPLPGAALPLSLGLGAALAAFHQAQPTLPGAAPLVQNLGDLGTFILGMAAMGAVVVWLWKAIKGGGGGVAAVSVPPDTALNAEQRTNAAVERVLDKLEENREYMLAEIRRLNDELLRRLAK